MKGFKEKYGPWALITGASGGIGAEFANQLAALGVNLVLVDRRKELLEENAKKLATEYTIDAKTVHVDLEEADFIKHILPVTDSLEIGLLVNNAGYAITGDFLEHDLEREVGLLNLNCRAPLILSHTFGRKMAERNRGGIIFLSSIAAFLPMPGWTQYSASKVYDQYLANGLNFELKKKGVDVLALCPGETKTGFGDVAGIKNRGMEPEAVVALALKKLGKKPQVVAGISNRIITFFTRFIGRSGNIMIGAKVVQDLMKTK